MSERNNEAPLSVHLSIPCLAEYVGVARLAVLGVASRLNFSYDEVEDLRLAVGEACAGAIDCAAKDDLPISCIDLHCEIQPNDLTVIVRYECHDGALKIVADSGDPENIGALLMEILVDSIDIQNDVDGYTVIRLTKTVQLP